MRVFSRVQILQVLRARGGEDDHEIEERMAASPVFTGPGREHNAVNTLIP